MPKLQRFDGPNAEQVRARVLAEVGPDAEIVRAGRERSGGLFGFFEKERFVLDVALPEAEPAPVGTPTMSALDHLAESRADTVAISAPGFEQSFSDVLEQAHAVLADAEVIDEGLDDNLLGDALLDEEAGQDPALPNDEIELDELTEDVRPALDDVTRAIESLGIAFELRFDVKALDVALLETFTGLVAVPALPPTSPGSALLVLGKGASTKRLAQLLATRMGLDEDSIVSVGLNARATRSLGAHGGALFGAQQVATRRVEGLVTILAVDLGHGALDATSLTRLVSGTRPDAIWAACAASDTAAIAELQATSGNLDAIALFDFAQAERPGALASMGIPVAYLDWHEATALMWAARCREQLSKSQGI